MKDLWFQIEESCNVTYFTSFRISPQELKAERFAHTVAKMSKDDSLHFPDLVFGVRIVCDVYKVSNLWWVHLFILRGQQHTSDPNQLEIGLGYIVYLQNIWI